MTSLLEDVFYRLVLTVCIISIIGVIGIIIASCIYIPVELSAKADCLAKGYPESRVTYDLKRYCTTLDGTITVRVIPSQ